MIYYSSKKRLLLLSLKSPLRAFSSLVLALCAVSVVPTASSAVGVPQVVQDVSGYNSWPMIQSLGDKLVCVYSRGGRHTIHESSRAVYARTSSDGGKTWSPEVLVANTSGFGDVAVGKGLDATGAMLVWVRRVGGNQRFHDLYRTNDGEKYTLVATPRLSVTPVQITDVFKVPSVGLMALWFGGKYSNEDPSHSWGTLVSRDDGKTWKQTVIESDLPQSEWPTEPSAVYLGDGKILVVARTENRPAATRFQFQMVSTDNGETWTRTTTNINDVYASTPSLILDPKTGLVSNYYYERGKGNLRRRVVDPQHVFDNPRDWPASEIVATGSRVTFDAGNVNATSINDKHYLTYYSGEKPDTSVLVLELDAPGVENKQ